MTTPIKSYNFDKALEGGTSFDFQLLEKSYHEYDSSHAHRHNYFEILFFHESGGDHEIDFNVHPVEANSVHLVSPDQIHVLRRGRNVTGYVLAFYADLFLNIGQNLDFIDTFHFFQHSYTAPIVHLEGDSLKQLLDVVEKIREEHTSTHENKTEMLALLVFQLLLLLKRCYPKDNAAPSEGKLTIEFQKLTKQNIHKLSLVSQYANLLCVSAGHLNDTIKRTTGKTAKAIINELKIIEAKRLLFHSKQTIKEIAFHLNFEDASYFNRFFQKQTGVSPLRFRQEIREKYH